MSYWVAFVVSFKFVVFDFSELAVQNRQPLPPDRPLHPFLRQRLRRVRDRRGADRLGRADAGARRREAARPGRIEGGGAL